MRSTIFFLSGLLACAAVARAADASSAESVKELKAFWREGQTFITWKELKNVKQEQYRIYMARRKLDPKHPDKAQRIATVGEGSCHNVQVLKKWGKRKKLNPADPAPRVDGYAPRYAIVDNKQNDPKKLLPHGTGLFVHTTHKPGRYFYAVLPVIGGAEQPERMAALEQPVEEQVMRPGAVIQWMHPDGKGAVYCHWMDESKWHPFCESYAYSFGVAVPKKYNGKDPLPITFYGHGMGGGYRAAAAAPYLQALWIWIGDETGSWFFGVMDRDRKKVVNYAEQRIRWAYAWLTAGRPNQFFRTDPRRVFGHGHSMGGTMMNACALRMGEIFGQTISSCGATIHRRNRTWVKQASRLWDTPEQNLPANTGSGAWDYQDYAKWSLSHIEQDSAYLVMNNGTKDGSVVFDPVPDFIAALQQSKRPFAAFWSPHGHSWSPSRTRNARWGRCQLYNDESLPAFSNASNNDDPRKTPSGQVNGKLEWCASGNDFDPKSKKDDLVDSEALWAVNIRALGGPATVDVTPRKVRHFRIRKGKTYHWENVDYSEPSKPRKVKEGAVHPDEHGLLTVKKFQAGSKGWGNRLIIRKP